MYVSLSSHAVLVGMRCACRHEGLLRQHTIKTSRQVQGPTATLSCASQEQKLNVLSVFLFRSRLYTMDCKQSTTMWRRAACCTHMLQQQNKIYLCVSPEALITLSLVSRTYSRPILDKIDSDCHPKQETMTSLWHSFVSFHVIWFIGQLL